MFVEYTDIWSKLIIINHHQRTVVWSASILNSIASLGWCPGRWTRALSPVLTEPCSTLASLQHAPAVDLIQPDCSTFPNQLTKNIVVYLTQEQLCCRSLLLTSCCCMGLQWVWHLISECCWVGLHNYSPWVVLCFCSATGKQIKHQHSLCLS